MLRKRTDISSKDFKAALIILLGKVEGGVSGGGGGGRRRRRRREQGGCIQNTFQPADKLWALRTLSHGPGRPAHAAADAKTLLSAGQQMIILIYDSLLIVNAYMQRVKTKLA
jgi:hypothetical protein